MAADILATAYLKASMVLQAEKGVRTGEVLDPFMVDEVQKENTQVENEEKMTVRD